MSSDIVIRLLNIAKSFQRYERPHHRLMQSIFRGKRQYYSEYEALSGISLDIHRGETVGIIGRNGAGKSTLLQLICGTMTPSHGSVEIYGRIAALLELGSGFNPDFTGRENVFMNASILGLKRKEIDQRFEEIAEFAGIGEFMEQPVKTYSSGMYVRLAFSVSINVVPEILIIDEALSVGDELFQRKCFSKIKQLQERGVAIIFVSHSASTILDICDRAVLLGDGKCIMDGNPKDVIDLYHKQLFEKSSKTESESEDALIRANASSNYHTKYFIENFKSESANWYTSNGATITAPFIQDENGQRVNILKSMEEYVYTYSVSFQEDCRNVAFSMSLQTKNGIQVSGANSADQIIENVQSGQSYSIRFNFKCLMINGLHFFNAGVTSNDGSGTCYLHRGIDVCAFKVISRQKDSVSGLCRVLSEHKPIAIAELINE